MKKLLILLLLPLLFGCEKYMEFSEPHLTGGKWVFVDYDIIPITSVSPVSIVKNDTICINSFGSLSYISGNISIGQNFNSTPLDRRFVKGKTVWQFDDNSYSLYCNFSPTGVPTHNRYQVTFPSYLMKEYDKMEIYNTSIGSVTNYSFETNAMGANYATKLTLLSPEIVTDLYLSNGARDKAVTVRILLKFMR